MSAIAGQEGLPAGVADVLVAGEFGTGITNVAAAVQLCEQRFHCGGLNSFSEHPVGACGPVGAPPIPGPPPPATSLFPGTDPAELGLIGRSLRLGRAIWCAARAVARVAPGRHARRHGRPRSGLELGRTAVALELFAGTGGGSTMLLAHGLSDGLGTLHTFERDSGNVAHARAALHEWGLRARALTLPPPGPPHLKAVSRAVSSSLALTLEAELAPGFGSQSAAALAGGFATSSGDKLGLERAGTWLWHGSPLALAERGTPGEQRGVPFLELLCSALPEVDLLVLDPQQTDLAAEWALVDRVCRPRAVAIHNINLVAHAGWIRDLLLKRQHKAIGGALVPTWREVLNGSHPSPWEEGGHRAWTFLMRVDAATEQW